MTTKTTIITAGKTASTSSDVTVNEGATVKVGIFPGAGVTDIPVGKANFLVWEKTPGEPQILARLDNLTRRYLVSGPIVFFVTRDVNDGPDYGAFTES